jgi:hypothetical protein
MAPEMWTGKDTFVAWFRLQPKGHHGYPQPEDNFAYKDSLYGGHCPVCGWHGPQTEALRLRGEPRAVHSQFLQVNWLFDLWLVRPEVAADLAAASISGVRFRSVRHYRTHKPLSTVVQLVIPTILPGVRPGGLKSLTCHPQNEEGWSGGTLAMAHPGGPPYCGKRKYHPATTLGMASGTFAEAPDVFQSDEWFGSGASAYRETLVSARFTSLVRARRWRGIDLDPVAEEKDSVRAT